MLEMRDMIEDRFEDLASSIIIQAADDYKRYRFVLDTIDLRSYKTEAGRYKSIETAKNHIERVKIFFRSAWFNELSDLDGEKALRGLEETYKKEYYPVRLEEMLDENKVGRFRIK